MGSLLLRPPLTPRAQVVAVGAPCASAATINVSALRQQLVSGKRAEHVNEVLLARSFAARTARRVSRGAPVIHLFLSCPYYDSMSGADPDPWRQARSAIDRQEAAMLHLILPRRRCAYVASHTLSYPHMFNRLRYCTALVEDKTYYGSDRDVVIPAGALQYRVTPPVERSCLLLFFGHVASGQGRYAGIRQAAVDSMRRAERDDLCFAVDVNASTYVRLISSAKFCIAPPGDTQGGEKLAIAIMNGCVPVIEYYDWSYQPFSSYLNYSKFAVRGFHNLTRLLDHLERAPYAELYANLVAAQRWFDYTRLHERQSPSSLILSSIQERWS